MTDTSTDTNASAVPAGIMSLIRAVILVVSTMVAADPALKISNGLVQQVGAGLIDLATAGWGVYAWFKAHEKLKAAIAAPAGRAS